MSDQKSTGAIEGKKKFTFKMPSAVVILISILFALVVLSWILSLAGASYTDDLGEETVVSAMGLFGVGTAMGQGFVNGADLIFYLFVLGAVIELMLVSGSMEAGISGLVRGFGGKELFLIPILVVLFSAGGMIYGMSEETIALFVIVVPALSLAGFDAVVGMMVILGGTATGCAMSVVNPFNVGAAAGAINDVLDGAYNQGVTLIPSLIWWVVLTAITASFVTGYAWMVKKSPEKSVNKQMKAETDEWLKGFGSDSNEITPATGRQKAALAVFMISFVLMILLFIPWPDVLGINTDDSWYYGGEGEAPWWTKIFAPFIGLTTPLGWWYFGELSALFILSGAIIALILGMGVKKTSETAWSGAKEMFSIAIVIGIARGIPVILETTGMQTVLVGGMISGLGAMSPMAFLYISFFIMLLLSTVITSTSGLAGATMGIFAASIFGPAGEVGASDAIASNGLAAGWGMTNSEALSYMGAIVIAYMMAIGIMNFFIPSNPIVMASMSQSRVAYGDGVKVMAPLAGIMLVITLVAILPSLALLW